MEVGWGQVWARELSEDMNHPAPFMGLFVCLFLTLALPGQVAKPTWVTLLWVSANNPPGILLELVAGTFARDMCVTHTDIRVPVRLR